jgi:hypothetical protein
MSTLAPPRRHRCRSCRDDHPHDRARWCRDCLLADARGMPKPMTHAERMASAAAILKDFHAEGRR